MLFLLQIYFLCLCVVCVTRRINSRFPSFCALFVFAIPLHCACLVTLWIFQLPETFDLLVNNLPKEKDVVAIKRRLKQLSDNCGGKVLGIQSNTATVRFNSADSSVR